MKPWIFWLILVPLFAWFGRDGVRVHAQTRLDFRTQMKRQPSVVLLQRSVCSETIPAPLASNCTGLELYSLSFSDGSTRILIGLPDDGTIYKNAKWNVVPITASGTGVTLGQVK